MFKIINHIFTYFFFTLTRCIKNSEWKKNNGTRIKQVKFLLWTDFGTQSVCVWINICLFWNNRPSPISVLELVVLLLSVLSMHSGLQGPLEAECAPYFGFSFKMWSNFHQVSQAFFPVSQAFPAEDLNIAPLKTQQFCWVTKLNLSKQSISIKILVWHIIRVVLLLVPDKQMSSWIKSKPGIFFFFFGKWVTTQ